MPRKAPNASLSGSGLITGVGGGAGGTGAGAGSGRRAAGPVVFFEGSPTPLSGTVKPSAADATPWAARPIASAADFISWVESDILDSLT
ncbi:Uncharacterised protein [Mycobacteroides abscessus subsp. abscessus]|nr:Uncharacterised protein [Mycobacteroides abscessus]SIC11572.1 Uncharacterised protein [Mycobacteroides abscessus subsp. abscessus]SIK99514.1 Uncharacterised protein [Mycobacteroides abscessus subsp. abscessus]SKX52794.1 Uncharacterised protein [Mycobacteroides abscessus subsp. abscessus]SLE47308.1 Uncharacterised protein [Mycobacteroides abscessus subsp. abscessus]